MQNVADLEPFSLTPSLNESIAPRYDKLSVTLKNYEDSDPFDKKNLPKKHTTNQVSSEHTLTNEFAEASVPLPTPQPAQSNVQTSVNGCILSQYGDDTVKCVLTIGDRSHESLLPLQLFVEARIEIAQGVAFTTQIRNEGGFKSLTVAPRRPTQDKKSKKEIFDLLAQL